MAHNIFSKCECENDDGVMIGDCSCSCHETNAENGVRIGTFATDQPKKQHTKKKPRPIIINLPRVNDRTRHRRLSELAQILHYLQSRETQ